MQIHRLFEIIHLLLNRETITAAELAARFEVSPRTVYRDVETLSVSGVPIYMSKGRGGGIRLMDGYVLNKTLLSPEERGELLSALQGMNATGRAEARAALEKLGALFGSAASPEQNWIEIDFSSWYNQEESSRKFDILKDRIRRRSPVAFTYYSGAGSETRREVEPLRLVYRGQAWYLFAYCRLRKEERFFKLTRISHLSALEGTFDRTHPEPVLNESNYLTSTRLVRIKLKIAKSAAFRVYDEFDRSRVKVEADGSFIVEFDFPEETGWLFSYITSFSDAAEVLEPPEVRDMMRDTLRNIMTKYEPPTK